jgi:hypothetical protein
MAKAAWHVMRRQVDYDAGRMFGQPAAKSTKELESRRQPGKGLDPEPCGLIGGGGSPDNNKQRKR